MISIFTESKSYRLANQEQPLSFLEGFDTGSKDLVTNSQGLSGNSHDLSESSHDLIRNSQGLSENSHDLNGNSQDLKGSSPYLGPNSQDLKGSSPYLKDKLAKILDSFGIGRMPRRMKATVMREVILQMCDDHPVTLKELSSLLERDPKALQDQYLTPMLSEGLLELKYPDNKNHPNQAYRRKK